MFDKERDKPNRREATDLKPGELHSDKCLDLKNRIKNLGAGRSLHENNIDVIIFNIVYPDFKEERDAGKLEFVLDALAETLTVNNLEVPTPKVVPPRPEPNNDE